MLKKTFKHAYWVTSCVSNAFCYCTVIDQIQSVKVFLDPSITLLSCIRKHKVLVSSHFSFPAVQHYKYPGPDTARSPLKISDILLG